MSQPNYLLTFENCPPNIARSDARDLEMALFQELPDITINWRPNHPRTQDIGSVLEIILPFLGTPVAVVFATALSDWLKRRKDITLTVRNGEKEVILQNITYREAELLLSRLTHPNPSEVSSEAEEKKQLGQPEE